MSKQQTKVKSHIVIIVSIVAVVDYIKRKR